MPRHPQGDKAMTGAERQRRWRERLRKEQGPAPDQSPGKENVALRRQFAAAQAEIEALRKRITELEAAAKSAPRSQPRQIEPEMTLDMISTKTGREQAEMFIRQKAKQFEWEIRQRVEAERRSVHDEMLVWLKGQLDGYNESARHYEIVLKMRKNGIMKRTEYRSILSCLHPDRVQDADLKRRYAHAFNLFTRMEKAVLDEKESPTKPSDLPKTVEELLKRKAEYQAQRAAARAVKRASAGVGVARRK